MRSSKNALSHRLATPIWVQPELEREALELVAAITNEHGSDPEVLQIARRLAEAEIDLARVRAVRAGLATAGLQGGEGLLRSNSALELARARARRTTRTVKTQMCKARR